MDLLAEISGDSVPVYSFLIVYLLLFHHPRVARLCLPFYERIVAQIFGFASASLVRGATTSRCCPHMVGFADGRFPGRIPDSSRLR